MTELFFGLLLRQSIKKKAERILYRVISNRGGDLRSPSVEDCFLNLLRFGFFNFTFSFRFFSFGSL